MFTQRLVPRVVLGNSDKGLSNSPFERIVSSQSSIFHVPLKRKRLLVGCVSYESSVIQPKGINANWAPPRQEGYDIVRCALGVSGRRSVKFPVGSTSRQFSTQAQANKVTRIGVIGAGVAGLQAVRALKAKGFDVTAFDGAAKIGGIWQQNYANYSLQVPKELYELNDLPMTEVACGEFPSGPQVQAYIERYAKHFGLVENVRLKTWVQDVRQNANGCWTVATNDGSDAFDFLVDATGLYSNTQKTLPDAVLESGATFGGPILHSTEFLDADMAHGKRVVLIGGAKSAIDIACESAMAGAKSVHLVYRDAHWPTPQKIAGLIPFQYVFLSRLGGALVAAHRGKPSSFGGEESSNMNALASFLVKPIFAAVELLFAAQMGLDGDRRPRHDVVDDFYGYGHVINSDLQDLIAAGKIQVVQSDLERFDEGRVVLADQQLMADMVICATGFKPNCSISMFSQPEVREALQVESDGIYNYRYILPPKVLNLAFVGKVATISNCSSYGLQAEWLARKLVERNMDASSWLSEQTMLAETAEHKRWSRSWMPHSHSRAHLALLHQTYYHDLLLQDINEPFQRKSNKLAEYLLPYESLDYDGIMGKP